MATEPIWPGRFFCVHLRFSRGVVTIAVIVVVLAVAISFGLYQLLKRAKPLAVTEPGCVALTKDKVALSLDVEQAQIAATIAAVAARRKLPERAVVIAYATALQESKLFNVNYGDRDSVGVFQQRESQGWGTKKQIMDPVYSANKFFAALAKVKGYRKMPIADAAQAVQRSAAGYAYAQHEHDARILAAAFTGRLPRAVHCVYPSDPGVTQAARKARTREARRQLTRALGSAAVTSEKRGWLIAAWSVAHAQEYGLSQVAYSGATWVNDVETTGWKEGGKAGARQVELA
ncbi:hypothetical protein [Nonomuraea sp. NPDC003214]